MRFLKKDIRVKAEHLFVALAVVYTIVENLRQRGNIERVITRHFKEMPDTHDQAALIKWLSDLCEENGRADAEYAVRKHATKRTSKKALRACRLTYTAMTRLGSIHGFLLTEPPEVDLGTSCITVRIKEVVPFENEFVHLSRHAPHFTIVVHVSSNKIGIMLSSSRGNSFEYQFETSYEKGRRQYHSLHGYDDERLLKAAAAGASVCMLPELEKIWLEDGGEDAVFQFDYREAMGELAKYVESLID